MSISVAFKGEGFRNIDILVDETGTVCSCKIPDEPVKPPEKPPEQEVYLTLSKNKYLEIL